MLGRYSLIRTPWRLLCHIRLSTFKFQPGVNFLKILEWLLDRQDLVKYRLTDVKALGSEEDYQKVMIFFTGVIQALGEKVMVPQQVIATAIVYFKRFYSRYSFKSMDPWLLAPTCIFLASKVEENGVLSHKNLVSICTNIVKSRYSSHIHEFTYKHTDILECEFILLEVMDCCLVVYHPYRSLILFCDDLPFSTQEVQSTAWRIINDSLRTDICLTYPPFLVALTALHMACVIENKNEAMLWFAELSVDMEKVCEISKQIMNLYEIWKTFNEEADIGKILEKLPKPQLSNSSS